MREVDQEKVQALRTHILEECKKQGFNLHEMQELICSIETAVMFRVEEVKNESF